MGIGWAGGHFGPPARVGTWHVAHHHCCCCRIVEPNPARSFCSVTLLGRVVHSRTSVVLFSYVPRSCRSVALLGHVIQSHCLATQLVTSPLFTLDALLANFLSALQYRHFVGSMREIVLVACKVIIGRSIRC